MANLAGGMDKKASITQEGGTSALVKLLSVGNKACVEHAAKALATLATNNESKVAIAHAGGIAPLVGLIKAENPAVREHATTALSVSQFFPAT
ncbi:hypothetical protein BSKO_00203 [Bryopsis sp. KO-2023]|nr:hypothetical protein BSKO_00203 [Bryopsis sp. KO-2023]